MQMYKNKTRNYVNPLHSAVQCTSIEIGSTTPTTYMPSTFPSRRRVGAQWAKFAKKVHKPARLRL